MTKILNKNVSLLLFIFAFAFFILQGYIALDPDFGWHLRFGEIISQTNQIPKTDPFSYTMPSYHFIDHEWLSDLIIAKSYPFLGQIGLSFIFALIAISAVFLQLKNLPKKWSFIPLCLIFSILLFFQGIRPQIISLFFMSLLIITLFNKKIYQKLKYFIPFVFLIWANLHGSFPVGLVVLGTFILSEIIEKRRISWGNLFILLASVFITFINPYGISLWKEILVTALDASLKWSVQEWTPSFFVVNIPLWVFLSLSGFIFIKYFTKFDLKEKMLFIILLLFGLSSIRNMLFFLFIGLIIIAKGFNFFYSTLGKYPLAKQRFFKILNLAAISSHFRKIKFCCNNDNRNSISSLR